MIKKAVLIILGLLVLLVGGALAAVWTSDMPKERLRSLYADDSSRFISLEDGTEMHVRVSGKLAGPVLLLIHGSNASLHTWDAWTELLGDRYRVITLDLPGHGLTGASPAGDYSRDAYVRAVDQVMTTLGHDRFFIGGNSMGGGVSAAYALAHPDKLQGLILVCSSGLAYPQELEWEPGLIDRIVATPYLRQIMTVVTPRSMIEDSLRSYLSRDEVITDAMIDRYWHLLRHPGNRQATLWRMTHETGGDLSSRLTSLDIPSLILWGEKDPVIPKILGDRFAELLPNNRYIVYPDIGHVPMEEWAEPSADDVADFIQTVLNGGEAKQTTVRN